MSRRRHARTVTVTTTPDNQPVVITGNLDVVKKEVARKARYNREKNAAGKSLREEMSAVKVR